MAWPGYRPRDSITTELRLQTIAQQKGRTYPPLASSVFVRAEAQGDPAQQRYHRGGVVF
jgi:hypothetical protein